jgi:hypothetical protein
MKVEHDMGMKFGDPASPLLVSVRSGAAISMPGMMDTVLNLGLNDEVSLKCCVAIEATFLPLSSVFFASVHFLIQCRFPLLCSRQFFF